MKTGYSLSDYHYDLPPRLIAQRPAERRDTSRLMILDRQSGAITHGNISDLHQYLNPGDCLVLNDSKVFPARIKGRKQTGGKVEVLLLNFPHPTGQKGQARARALTRASKPLRPGQKLFISDQLEIVVENTLGNGHAELLLLFEGDIEEVLKCVGHMPLPPYIRRSDETMDIERYQTVYAQDTGSVAAPTAGLHFTEELLTELTQMEISVARVTLHVGYGTFAPVRTEDIREHKIHTEWIKVSRETADTINAAKQKGKKIVAVGTTSVRTLEYCTTDQGGVRAYEGPCDLYIFPGFRFRTVDAMLTNFHLPKSSLLILVSAFAGRDRIMAAYREAINHEYRFYSYGDAMLIL